MPTAAIARQATVTATLISRAPWPARLRRMSAGPVLATTTI
jgi:hypothetical protein